MQSISDLSVFRLSVILPPFSTQCVDYRSLSIHEELFGREDVEGQVPLNISIRVGGPPPAGQQLGSRRLGSIWGLAAGPAGATCGACRDWCGWGLWRFSCADCRRFGHAWARDRREHRRARVRGRRGPTGLPADCILRWPRRWHEGVTCQTWHRTLGVKHVTPERVTCFVFKARRGDRRAGADSLAARCCHGVVTVLSRCCHGAVTVRGLSFEVGSTRQRRSRHNLHPEARCTGLTCR
jgi:hypothetical protein